MITKIGMLALDLGADTDIADNPREALEFCAARKEHLSQEQQLVFNNAYDDARRQVQQENLSVA
ncbi:hypothetical protein ACX9MO_16670 [Pseudooceanicola sp. 502str34]